MLNALKFRVNSGLQTLRSDEDERNFSRISVMRHLRVIAVNRVKAGLVLQAEDENDSIDPGGELEQSERVSHEK